MEGGRRWVHGAGQAFVRALLFDGDDLYAGGFFRFAGGEPANYIARWDGTRWDPLGEGLDYTVKNIRRHGDYVYVTGEFAHAGGMPSALVARWNPQGASAAIPSAPMVSQNYPNPFNPSTTIDYSIPQGARVRLAVYDVRGALVKTLVDADKSAGPHAVEWDGRNDGGQRVGSGIYFYRLEAPGATLTKKMVFLK